MKKKLFFIAFVAIITLVITANSYAGNFMGRDYDATGDYSCCQNGQLTNFHYYESYFFWIKTGEGFQAEPLGVPSKGCDIPCPR